MKHTSQQNISHNFNSVLVTNQGGHLSKNLHQQPGWLPLYHSIILHQQMQQYCVYTFTLH